MNKWQQLQENMGMLYEVKRQLCIDSSPEAKEPMNSNVSNLFPTYSIGPQQTT